ncbi:MAG: class I SAM-dependent methyltransferase [Nitrospinota bacterium]
MGFYEEQIFSRVMDWSMGSRRVQEERERALAPASGDVLEIGFGTGLNLPHYPEGVTCVTAIDPASLRPEKRNRRMAAARMPVELVRRSAETLPLEDGRFDCVVSTWTLCTIADAVAALREVGRVLKPEGRFIFLEHGRSNNARVAKWQDRLNPIQRKIACGCNMNRPIDALIHRAGLAVDSLDRFLMPGVPRILGEMYRGIARTA